ncbi:hypothetical protein KM043_014204 [Ampulex compressa]|nr:hypothetical protein KM043_014204 [Ampulex compressa]
MHRHCAIVNFSNLSQADTRWTIGTKRSSGEKTKRHVLSFEIWNASRNSSLEGFCAGSTILATFKLDENPDASTTENLQGTWRSFEHT